MLSEFVEVLILVVRGALFAGLCWGAWLCLGEPIAPARLAKSPPPNHQPLKRFATLAVLILLLTALGGLVADKARASPPSAEKPAPAAESPAG